MINGGGRLYTASFQVVPIKASNLTEVMDKVIDVIENSGLRYEVNAHSTVVEGEVNELLKIQKEVIEICEGLCERCVFTFQIDIKRGGVSIDEKVRRYRMGS